MEIILLFAYTCVCLLMGLWGTNKMIGFLSAFLLSFVLTPLIGFWIILFSKDKTQFMNEQNMMRMQFNQMNAIQQIQRNQNNSNIATELEKLERLKVSGSLNEDEYIKLKNKLIN